MRAKVVMIDNYDSFSWNLYEYMSQEGAEVIVFRNDAVTVEQIEALRPDCVVISPGPGHPLRDSGVSIPAIRHFSGKVPVVGICMGLQCIFAAFGGEVARANEIWHGKTSCISHDGLGLFKGVNNGIAVTRYHSLAGSPESLPTCLAVTSRTFSGIIMGVRHTSLCVEGLQFHPESILTEQGREMVRNIVQLATGTHGARQSVLEKIYAQRQTDVDLLRATPGFSHDDLAKSLALGLAPAPVSLADRLRSEKGVALIAEVKRASPSKGPIELSAHAPSLALQYAACGACAVSVLTEPHWFRGSLQDLEQTRRALESVGPSRPALLRKDFIFCEYQILEARLAGADSVLLIVKMLANDLPLLQRLYSYSLSLGMDPLVEVASAAELQLALRHLTPTPPVIGVNNRDLHSFDVDLSTTSKLVNAVPPDTVLVALSGISSPDHVRAYRDDGVHAVLVGESLMRAPSLADFAKSLRLA